MEEPTIKHEATFTLNFDIKEFMEESKEVFIAGYVAAVNNYRSNSPRSVDEHAEEAWQEWMNGQPEPEPIEERPMSPEAEKIWEDALINGAGSTAVDTNGFSFTQIFAPRNPKIGESPLKEAFKIVETDWQAQEYFQSIGLVNGADYTGEEQRILFGDPAEADALPAENGTIQTPRDANTEAIKHNTDRLRPGVQGFIDCTKAAPTQEFKP